MICELQLSLLTEPYSATLSGRGRDKTNKTMAVFSLTVLSVSVHKVLCSI